MAELIDLLDNIENTLGTASSVTLTESYDELSEGIAQTPLLQVYPARNPGTSRASETDRITFGGSTGGVLQKVYEIHADLFVTQRHYLAQDMRYLVESVEELEAILEEQPKTSPFDDDNVSSFQWSWERVTFEYSGQRYLGVKFVITAIVTAPV